MSEQDKKLEDLEKALVEALKRIQILEDIEACRNDSPEVKTMKLFEKWNRDIRQGSDEAWVEHVLNYAKPRI